MINNNPKYMSEEQKLCSKAFLQTTNLENYHLC